MHHIGIHVTQALMPERLGQRPHDGKPELLPQRHRRRVGAHHKIELHRPVTRPHRLAQAMQPRPAYVGEIMNEAFATCAPRSRWLAISLYIPRPAPRPASSSATYGTTPGPNQ